MIWKYLICWILHQVGEFYQTVFFASMSEGIFYQPLLTFPRKGFKKVGNACPSLFNSMYDSGCRHNFFWLNNWFIHPGTKAVAIGGLGEYRKNAELPVHKCIFLPTQASDGLDATREEINNARRMKDLMTSSSECHQVFQGHLFITITIIIIHCWIPILSICMKKYFLGTKTCFVKRYIYR